MRSLITAFVLLLAMNVAAQDHDQANYDETKVPAYVLPDILKAQNGQRITSKTGWEKTRRPEILRLFEDNIYGQMPKAYDSLKFVVVNDDRTAMAGKAHLKQIEIEVFNKNKSVKIHLSMFVPTGNKKPSPVFLLINNRGLENTDITRTKKSEFWAAELLIDSGYAIAAFNVNDLAPDNPKDFMNGVLQLYPEQLTADNGMRAIGAWAWGASRVMDYFEKDKDINAKQVILVGHSRGGKASLWAAAEDQRFAVCIANCSGNTGAALSRRQFGERVNRINTSYPYWFNNTYKKFNGREGDLPVDQHMLLALIAPRPLYTTNASKDLWADPKGSYLAVRNTEKAYELYGFKSGLPPNQPGINMPVTNSKLGYHIREGIHDMTIYDWTNFIIFSNHQLMRKNI